MRIGAWHRSGAGTEFCVWAPRRSRVEVVPDLGPPVDLARDDQGYWSGTVRDAAPGFLYRYRLDGETLRPDPASHCQPDGVHRSSCVVDHDAFDWADDTWTGIPLERMVVYELHIGTFTPEGTFDAVIPHLQDLHDLGITAIELMPLAQFPGERNWGYDGVYPFAAQWSYGGPLGLKRLVDAAHRTGLAVVLDVVYNHLGPEGNYLWDYGPYFTNRYRTPWGDAVNFDGPDSDHVREFFVQNALFWCRDYHIDGLRVDAVHAIYDRSASPFLRELTEAVHLLGISSGFPRLLIAESNLNDSVVIRPPEQFGHGFDAQWSDDFHHAIHTLLTGERDGYYVDFGERDQLRRCLLHGAVFAGDYSKFRRRRHGNSPEGRPARQFVVFAQNHDQIGNRMHGERLTALLPFEAWKLVSGLVILSPYVPLLFMGEEYGELAPFPFFVSHGDPDLVEAVRRGRREEFRTFSWEGEPPDPQSPATFASAILQRQRRAEPRHRSIRAFTAELLRLRRTVPALALLDKSATSAEWIGDAPVLRMERRAPGSRALALFHLGTDEAHVSVGDGPWTVLLDSRESRWGGPGGDRLSEIGVGTRLVIPPYGIILASRT